MLRVSCRRETKCGQGRRCENSCSEGPLRRHCETGGAGGGRGVEGALAEALAQAKANDPNAIKDAKLVYRMGIPWKTTK